MFFYVSMTVVPTRRTRDPREQRNNDHNGNEHHPEPDEQVDHFVEEVYRKNALNRVPLNVA